MNNFLNTLPMEEWHQIVGEAVKKFSPYCKSVPSVEPKDLTQEAWIGILKAQNSFDPNRGTKFSTWAYIFIHGQLSSIFKKQYTKSSYIDVDILANTLEDKFKDFEVIERNEILNMAFDSIKAEKHIELLYEYFIENKTYDQIAKNYGVSTQTIINRVKALIMKLNKQFNYENARNNTM